MSNTGFLFLFRAFWEKILQESKRQMGAGSQEAEGGLDEAGGRSLRRATPHSLPEEFPKEGVQHGEDEVHDEKAIHLLAHKVLPALWG